MRSRPIGAMCVAYAGARTLFLLSCYVAVAASTGAAIAEEKMTFVADAQWKVVDTSDVLVKAGSAMDLSAVSAVPLVDGPAAGSKRLPRLVIGPSGKLVAKGKPENPVRLKGFIFHVVDDDAMSFDGFSWFGVCAVDGNDLAESQRMVLLYTTKTANTGMVVTPDRTKMFNYGTLPVLMKVGRLDATLQNAHGKNMAIYAIGLNGARRQRLPLACKDGRLKIHLDTASLERGPTAFFELTVD